MFKVKLIILPLIRFNTSYVVIKPEPTAKTRSKVIVSIHLMLLLNILQPIHCPQGISVSIHLMLLLNYKQSLDAWHLAEFQYILCCY